MLFNSPEFIYYFLPIVIIGFYALKALKADMVAGVFLVIASIYYYAWWNPLYVPLICASMTLNYLLGSALAKFHRSKLALLVSGLVFNLGLLAYFKYAGFLVMTVDFISGSEIPVPHIVLPLAISFFTFQQIAFLVDTYRGQPVRNGFFDYALFVSFFPQLIAGPIVHHAEMMPQFNKRFTASRIFHNILVGLLIFSIGLAKKVVIADTLSPIVHAAFSHAETAGTISFSAAWLGVLSYTFQIYFDFSGYCDMASGVAFAIGIRLPVNFFSPYKARNIQDFWRRWHITLSRFLRDYLYIPLGGSRCSRFRTMFNLFLTMLLGGLWHGAGWNFVIWGGLHGVYLAIHKAWNGTSAAALCARIAPLRTILSLVTFLAVVFAWVFFRAPTFHVATHVLSGMFMPAQIFPDGDIIPTIKAAFYVFVAIAITFLMPNTYEILRRYKPVLNTEQFFPANARRIRPANLIYLVTGMAFAIGLACLDTNSEFLYFQF